MCARSRKHKMFGKTKESLCVGNCNVHFIRLLSLFVCFSRSRSLALHSIIYTSFLTHHFLLRASVLFGFCGIKIVEIQPSRKRGARIIDVTTMNEQQQQRCRRTRMSERHPPNEYVCVSRRKNINDSNFYTWLFFIGGAEWVAFRLFVCSYVWND